MYKLCFASDIHLNHATKERVGDFIESIINTKSNGLLITGDICDGKGLMDYLKSVAEAVNIQIYFVLGNHDYYFGSISEQRHKLRDLPNNITYLSSTSPIELTSGKYLIGHDGWYDGKYGSPYTSGVQLNDWYTITELKSQRYNRQKLVEACERLASQSVVHIRKNIELIADKAKEIIIGTHVPPFLESATYNGKVSDRNWAPWFTNKALGDLLEEKADKYENVRFTVYCGHSHGGSVVKKSENLTITTASARYEFPTFSSVYEIE